MNKYIIIFSLLFLSLIGSSCSTMQAINTAKKVRDARTEGENLKNSLPLVKDKQVVNYIDSIGRKLINSTPATSKKLEIPISFHIINVNAKNDVSSFTVGGYVFLDRPAIELYSSEGVIAGIMAHEIAHNYLGHVIDPGEYSDCKEESKECFDKYYQHTRQDELDADALGVQIMVNAGYDPNDLAKYFLVLAAQLTKEGGQSYPSHPSLYERVKKINALAKTLKVSKTPLKKTAGITKVREILKSIPTSNRPALRTVFILATKKARSKSCFFLLNFSDVVNYCIPLRTFMPARDSIIALATFLGTSS